MHQDIERVLISEQELAARIAELGKQVAADYADKDPIFLGILKGVVMFFSDMIRATPIQCQIDFMAVSSYGGGTSTSGKVKMLKDVSVDLRGRHVVILEDILDSGVTLSHVCAHLREMGPASLEHLHPARQALAAARRTSRRTTSALRSRTNLSSAMASTMTSTTATCRMSAS